MLCPVSLEKFRLSGTYPSSVYNFSCDVPFLNPVIIFELYISLEYCGW